MSTWLDPPLITRNSGTLPPSCSSSTRSVPACRASERSERSCSAGVPPHSGNTLRGPWETGSSIQRPSNVLARVSSISCSFLSGFRPCWRHLGSRSRGLRGLTGSLYGLWWTELLAVATDIFIGEPLSVGAVLLVLRIMLSPAV